MQHRRWFPFISFLSFWNGGTNSFNTIGFLFELFVKTNDEHAGSVARLREIPLSFVSHEMRKASVSFPMPRVLAVSHFPLLSQTAHERMTK